jgi:hypothetical protein
VRSIKRAEASVGNCSSVAIDIVGSFGGTRKNGGSTSDVVGAES